MPRKIYTILILSSRRRRFRQLRVSRAVLLGGLASLLLVGVGVVAAPQLFLEVRSQSGELARLEQENRLLRSSSDSFEQALGEIREQLDVFEAHTARLAQELGVQDLPAMRPAAGGANVEAARSGTILGQELSSLKERTANVDTSLSELDMAFHKRLQLLASTPNQMPVQGWFSHGFGWRKDPWTGEREFHRGIDIVADRGTDILAPADGLVSRTARKVDYGKTLDLSHGHGYVTRYAHLSEVLVRAGQKIRRGDVIGRVGSTGRSTGPHLHYEVFRDGRRVNPWKYLGQKGS